MDSIRKNETPSIIIGKNAVMEALKSDTAVDTVYVAPGKDLGALIKLAKEKGAVVKDVDSAKLNQLAGGKNAQGVAAQVSCANYISVQELLDISKQKGTKPFIIICDEIEDPHNLGAIIRTAESAGADGIIIPKRRSATLNLTVHKTSAGAASWLPVARVPNLASAIETLKKNGVWVFGADMDGESCYDTDLKGAVALVIGSEGFGMGRLVKEKCDGILSIPMNGKINSLNASVAASILIYETVRQRLNK
ncbi:MAG: 23S rRNA (guanosine(2251)-2'-O)-methyltransferase RlmB [Oscillospiraceae bacterium]|nr:23S rRNA (guanosine(2251)-2'-O)-methyltransferase RlmB [Oscillospiraceae bacterium]